MLRLRYRAALIVLLAGCSREGDPPPDGTTPTTPTTETRPVGPDVLDASCALSADNPLRVECSATLVEAGPTSVELTAAGAPARTFASADSAVDHALVAWGLKPETAYEWRLGEVSGSVTTGAVDPDLAGASIAVDGDASGLGFDAILQPLACDAMWMVMIDTDGDIVWYEPTDLYATRRDGYEWAPDDRSVLTIGDGQLLETHVSGAERLHLQRGSHFDGDLHHDLTRWGPYTYVLFEERVGSLVVDGLYVFEGTDQLGRFFLGDHYTIPSSGTGDWSHANGLNATSTGELVMSLHTFSNVLGIDGDPASASFLDITWLATGTGAGLPNPTHVPAAGPREGFEGQHNAQRLGDELWLFDNTGVSNRSRGAVYALDEGEVRLTAEWELQTGCPVQGGAIPVDGGAVLTCSNVPIVVAFETAGTESAWSLQATCTSTTDTMIRGIPVTIE